MPGARSSVPTRFPGQSLRLFSEAPGAPPAGPRRPKPKKPSGPPTGKVTGVFFLAGCGAYAASSDARDMINGFAGGVGERFEDFNDWTREKFEAIGDRFVSKRDEPWLLELATMKYPENIPTLVMDLDKVLLHLEHDHKQGWIPVKRPFAEQFFKELAHYYELVIFSDDVFPVALEIANKWNIPVTGVLHRDFCKKKRTHYVKDLSKLGRKLDKVIMIDHDPAAFQLQPENGILIKAFEGDPSDSELADLLDFLKAAAQNPGDIRQFVEKFGGGDEDLGRRYLIHKQEQDKIVESRRAMGRAFTSGQKRGFPQPPPQQGFGGGNMRF